MIEISWALSGGKPREEMTEARGHNMSYFVVGSVAWQDENSSTIAVGWYSVYNKRR
jgi:hypothetical protein